MSKSKIQVGDTFTNNQGCKAVVINWNNHKSVLIKFQDSFGCEKEVESRFLKRGGFKNPYFKSVCSVGYIGEGAFNSSVDRKTTHEYQTWIDMMKRCYSVKSQKSTASTYTDCTVCDEWHNFQLFAEWLTSQPFYSAKSQLDKDILKKGNRIYSPKNCCIVPRQVNMLLHNGGANQSTALTGATIKNNGKHFEARLSAYGRDVYIGRYDSEQEAHQAYVAAKEAYVKEVANKWRGRIDERVYDALMNWTVN